MVLIGPVTKMVKHNSWLHPRVFSFGVQFFNAVEVLGKIHDDRDVAALPSQACSASTGEDGRSMAAGERDGLNYIVDRLGDDNTDRDLAVIRAIYSVKRAAAIVETNFALNDGAQFLGQDVGAVTRKRRKLRRPAGMKL